MQVSISWLKKYIDFSETPEVLADKLTLAGIPVENIYRPGAEIERVVTGKILKIEKHPNADKLCVCTMSFGTPEEVVIVTGATNVREGQIVPVATVGAHLPGGVKISKGKPRGVASYGMLCSAQELNIDLNSVPEESRDGIYILPADTPIGIDVKTLLGLDEVILEFELTANRADCFSVLGIVREIAVLTGNTPKKPMIHLREDAGEKAADLIAVRIEAPELCARFSARVLRDVKVGPSPVWMQKCLESAGIRSISNVVDVTNFVMLELGQPMHAYDYEMISGHTLIARKARPGEPLTTLDSVKRETRPEMLVISDAIQAAGLGGVMGGLATEVTDCTRTVVLEAASFNGVNVRRTSRALGLHSEASGRFERGIDKVNTTRALDRAAQLLQEMGACRVCEGIVDAYPGFELPSTVVFTAEQINRRLGTDIEEARMIEILKALEFDLQVENGKITVTVPSWRNDVRLMEDISEEIARIYGFDHIRSTLPSGDMMQGGQSDKQNFADRVKEILCGIGMSEILSFSFTHPATFDKLLVPADSKLRNAVPILNPITDEFPLLRTTILSSLLETVARNLSRKNEDIRIFEIGSVFEPKALPIAELPNERIVIGGALSGRRAAAGWNQTKESVDFYDAKGIVETLFEKLGIDKYTVEVGAHFALHPGRTAVFKKGKEIVAYVGEVHPQALEKMDIGKRTYVFEIELDMLMRYAVRTCRYASLPKYPAISRDLALVVAADVPAGQVEKAIVKYAGSLLQSVGLFDVYTGTQIAEGQKSLAFSLQFQSSDRTLIDEEVDGHYTAVLHALEEEFGAKLRS